MGGREGALLSERQTRALAAHMNGIWGGGTLPQFHCQGLPMTTGHPGSAVDLSCDAELDAHWLHRTATLMI